MKFCIRHLQIRKIFGCSKILPEIVQRSTISGTISTGSVDITAAGITVVSELSAISLPLPFLRSSTFLVYFRHCPRKWFAVPTTVRSSDKRTMAEKFRRPIFPWAPRKNCPCRKFSLHGRKCRSLLMWTLTDKKNGISSVRRSWPKIVQKVPTKSSPQQNLTKSCRLTDFDSPSCLTPIVFPSLCTSTDHSPFSHFYPVDIFVIYYWFLEFWITLIV